jgi:hypothetical protein
MDKNITAELKGTTLVGGIDFNYTFNNYLGGATMWFVSIKTNSFVLNRTFGEGTHVQREILDLAITLYCLTYDHSYFVCFASESNCMQFGDRNYRRTEEQAVSADKWPSEYRKSELMS